METTKLTTLDSAPQDLVVGQAGGLAGDATDDLAYGKPEREAGSEWSARPLRPVAHWVLMPTTGGRARLEMVWEAPDPIPASFTA
jgi:hypothetical protein